MSGVAPSLFIEAFFQGNGGWVGWGSNPQPTPIAKLSGLLDQVGSRTWAKILEHRDGQLWILLGFQLPFKNPGLFNRFEFQNGNCLQ